MSTFTTEIPVRFRDVDSMGHVNNAVYATYLEQARVAYFRGVLDRDLSAVETVLASLSIDYRAPIGLDDEAVTVTVDVPEIGTTSVPMTYTIETDSGVAAEAESVQVSYDAEAGEPVVLPEDWRSTIREYHDL
ncbi:acyl-CoA thioester hydrolase [Halopenitus malekzadehii]|uniref:Acyl-CoA thioester hydrolase n=1 Tax=Halopenitus malekzadehii TaxID=1267564 RepID=A0A1H6JIN9_9EURY|nr:thioesterase family protein [Halopenitus malekzadehii]SEH62204.1 acyl-CoA thioester hydrolase [Halopenitus malekzadehii]